LAVTHAEATRERERYASALDGLWRGLGRPLARLERYAADPESWLWDGPAQSLSALQYELHRSGELAAGIVAPPGTEAAHEELAAALVDARDATGDIVELLEAEGPEGAAILVHEWRGALFRVRLARRRLAAARPLPAMEPAEERRSAAAVASVVCLLAGTAAFTCGAVLAVWPVWAAGLALVAASFLVYRP
jgi:hypothetical protein